MAEALKDVYTKAFFLQFLRSFKKVIPTLKKDYFLAKIFTPSWKNLELKARVSHIAEVMQQFLPEDFKQAAPILLKLTEQLIKEDIKGGYEHLFIPEYIEKNGLNNEKEALYCIEKITQFVSCEFAVRPFIRQNSFALMKQLYSWSKHPSEEVRRLSSECCRPRLPWAKALVEFKKDPSPILPILDNLKADESLYVKKSVANNLNDISKDHPELFLQIAKKWIGKNEHTNWILKHASRTLLKEGNQEVLSLFGYAKAKNLELSDFKLKNPRFNIGDSLKFEFKLKNTAASELKLRLEYGIYFKKQNGTNKCKVFKISDKKLGKKEKITVSKSHRIKEISTRKYYEGTQFISLIINGIELQKLSFTLKI